MKKIESKEHERMIIVSVKINFSCRVFDLATNKIIKSMPLEKFRVNVLIEGRNNVRRLLFLSHILTQFREKAPDIGVLLVKLDINTDLFLCDFDAQYKYGENDLEIPYYCEQELNEVNREKFTKYVNAICGFHFEMKIVVGNFIRGIKLGEFPSSIVDFLDELRDYLIKHPYSGEFTESNARSIENMISFFQNDPILEKTLWISLDLPEWLRQWENGRMVCIDLSECELYHQKILVTLILQAVKNLTPVANSDIPVGVVVLEDVDDVFEKVPHEEYIQRYRMNSDYWNDISTKNYFLTKEQLEEVYGDKNYLMNVQLERAYEDSILDEFHYRDISLITVCVDASKIYEAFLFHSYIQVYTDRQEV